MGQILFRNCNLLDAAAGETRPAHHVLVEGDRIAEVSDREIRAPQDPLRDLSRLEGQGKYLDVVMKDGAFFANRVAP